MTHVMEGDLMRWMDGETDAAEGATLEAHVETCVPCRARLDTLRRRDAAWRRAVVVLDDDRVPRRSARWAWAAAILVLLGVGAGVQPVRAWIVSQSRALWEAVAGRPETVPVTAPAEAVSRVRFVPLAGPFTVSLSHPQAEGRLVLETAPGEAAEAWVAGAPDAADLVVLPSGLQIRNEAGAAASYHVRLPGATTTVELRIGGVTHRVTVPATIPLGRSPGGGSLQEQEETP